MNSISQDLQATYQVLSLLERSKAYSDRILDKLPGIFVVIDPESRVLKGNVELGTLYGVDFEQLLSHRFSELFQVETWEIFNLHLKKLVNESLEFIEFELNINKNGVVERPFFWYVSPFDSADNNHNRLFSVIGKDISQLRRTEKQLTEIFASIPLGIVSSGTESRIESKYSAYTEWLLGTKQIAGLTAKELLFQSPWEDLSPAEQQAVDQLPGTIGQEELIFDVTKSGLPRQIRFPMPVEWEVRERYLGLTYQPIVYSGMVSKVLIIVEDRTALVLAKAKEQQSSILNEIAVSRIIQMKQCASDVLPLLMEELGGLFERTDLVIQERNQREFASLLHGIKGNARVAGFDLLKNAVHLLEAKVQSKDGETREIPWDSVALDWLAVQEEWKELLAVYNALILRQNRATSPASTSDSNMAQAKTTEMVKRLFARFNELLAQGESSETVLISERISLALQSLSHEPLDDLENLVKLRVMETAKEQEKRVEVDFKSNGTRAEPRCKAAFSEVLLHLLNNAVAHGIESPSEREAKGKSPIGLISVSVRERSGTMECVVSDDGGGANTDKIKNTAVKQKLISFEESLSMSRKEIIQLIFTPGFSTSTEVDEVSGRGVGLDAVVSRLAEFGGTVSVREGAVAGAEFHFDMKTGQSLPVQRTFVAVSDFMRFLHKSIESLNKQELMNIEFEKESANGLSRGIMYCDFRRIALAVTTYLGSFSGGAKVHVHFSRKEKHVHCVARRENQQTQATSRPVLLEFDLPLPTCEGYIKQHQGQVTVSPSTVSLEFGHLIAKDLLPTLKLGLGSEVQISTAKKTLDRIMEVAADLEVAVEYLWEAKAGTAGQTPDIVLGKVPGKAPAIILGSAREVVRKEILGAVNRLMGSKSESLKSRMEDFK